MCENTSNLAPTELLGMLAIGISVTTPIIGKVSAISLALLFGEKSDVSGCGRDKRKSGEPKDSGERSFLSEGGVSK